MHCKIIPHFRTIWGIILEEKHDKYLVLSGYGSWWLGEYKRRFRERGYGVRGGVMGVGGVVMTNSFFSFLICFSTSLLEVSKVYVPVKGKTTCQPTRGSTKGNGRINNRKSFND